jgi:hypothetical protein
MTPIRNLPRAFFALLSLIVCAGQAAAAETQACCSLKGGSKNPVKIIFDSDMGNDVDDVIALILLNRLQDRGLCDVLAVTLTTPDPLAAPYTVALNRATGYPNIPVGTNLAAPDGRFPGKKITAPYYDGTRKRFATLADRLTAAPTDYPTALQLLRKTLAAAEDNSVVIVQVGSFNNLADLLRSGPDAFSPLNGRDLAAKKVRFLSLMAGDSKRPEVAEYNVKLDADAAREVVRDWPTPRYWSAWEVGAAVTFPAVAITDNLPPGNILRESYQRYNPVPHERPLWDPTSAWFAVFPKSCLLGTGPAVRASVIEDGKTRFAPDAAGQDFLLTVTPEQAAVLRVKMAEIVTGWAVK